MNKNLFNPEEELKKFLSERKEEKYLKRPSISFLKNYAENILKVAKFWQDKNTFSLMSYTSVRLSINIFLADVDSDLNILNDKKYNIVWNNKYNKLRFLQSNFLDGYLKELENI